MTAVLHRAAPASTVGSTVIQLCSLCSAVLDEVHLDRTASAGPRSAYPIWPTNAIVLVDGGFRMTIAPESVEDMGAAWCTPDATDQPIPADVVLPCGCIIRCSIVDGVNTMTMTACRAGCTNVAAALQEADNQGKPAEVRRRG